MQQKFTTRFQEALQTAQSLAVGKDHNYIEPAHIFMALLQQQGGAAASILQQAGANVPALRQAVDKIINDLPRVSHATGQVNLSPDSARLLNLCDKYAQQNGDPIHFFRAVSACRLRR